MPIAFDATIGNTGTGTTSNASLNHAANVAVVINVSYLSNITPVVTIAGTVVNSIAKVSYGSSTTTEVFFIFRTGAANESIVVTFGNNTRHAWNAVSYTGVVSTSSYESLTTNSGTGASPVTSSVTVPVGTTGRWLINCNGARDASNGTATITIAPANGETERDERDLAGTSSTRAQSAQIQDYPSAAARTLQATHTASGRSMYWTTVGFGLKPAVELPIVTFVKKSGRATGTTVRQLIDTTLNQFNANDVGKTVWNSTNDTYAKITGYLSSSVLELDIDIMEALDYYEIEPILYLDSDSFTPQAAITSVGAGVCHTRGFCYINSEVGTPTTSDPQVYNNGVGSYGVGEYLIPIISLNSGSHYRIRAFAINATGTGYSDTITIQTPIIVYPTAITQPASAIESTLATVNGKISEDGGAFCEARFRWRLYTPFPYTFPFTFAPEGTETAWQGSFTEQEGFNAFHDHLTGLTPGTQYSFMTQARSWTTPEDQILYNSVVPLYDTHISRVGQRRFILDQMITTLSYWLSKTGLPTGDVTFTIRKVSDDSIITSKVWGDASLLDGTPTKRTVTFSSPVLIDEEVRILCEYNEGSSTVAKCVNVSVYHPDTKADEVLTYYDEVLESLVDDSNYDCAYEYEYHLTGEWSIAEQFTTLAAFAYVYLTGALTFAGTLSKETTKYLTGALLPSGALAKTISKYLTGALSFIGAILAARSGQFYVYLTGSLTFAGSLKKTTTKYLTGALTPVGRLIKTTTKYITGALSFLGGLSRPGEPHTMGLFTIPYRDMRAFSRPYRDMAVESRPYRDMITENREVKL